MEDYKKSAHGEFCWMELRSKNVETCKSFYTELFSARIPEPAMPEEIKRRDRGAKRRIRISSLIELTERRQTKSFAAFIFAAKTNFCATIESLTKTR